MPQQNGTGPMGAGPMTGRGLGPCGGGQAQGRGFGRGMGLRQGSGRGWFGRGMCRFWPGWNATAKDRKQALEDEAKMLEQDLADVKAELDGLEKDQN